MLRKSLTLLSKPDWHLDDENTIESRRSELLKRLSNYHTVPGHGPNISEMSDDKLESYTNMLDRMFKLAYQEKNDVEDKDI
jgi:hypothetical protein